MINNCIENLSDLKNLVTKLDSATYSKELSVFEGNTLGKHIRHIVEFYQSVVFCEAGEIFYDNRKRDFELETDPNFCGLEIELLLQRLMDFEKDFEVKLITELGNFKSTFYRELYYVLEHSVHHEALLKIGLRELNCENLVSGNFGVASSTKKSREKCAP